MSQTTQRLLQRVAARLGWAEWGRRAHRAFWLALAACALWVVVDRLWGIGSWWASPPAIAMLTLVVAGAAAWIGFRRPTAVEAARAVDRHAESRDLFLTDLHVRDGAEGFEPVVRAQAEGRAATVRPGAVVPMAPPGRWLRAAAGIAGVLALAAWLPAFDLLGSEGLAKDREQVRRVLEEQTAEAVKKAEVLAKKNLDAPNSEQVAQSMQQLAKAFQSMERPKPEENDRKLAAEQKELGEAWRKLREQGLKKLGTRSDQQFGGKRDTKTQKWSDELRKGSTAAMQQELDDIAEKARAAAEEKDPEKKAEQTKELRDRIKQLEEFARNEGSTPGMKKAMAQMQQALSQLDTPGMESEALAALEAAAQLSKMEAGALAQMARDLQGLEKALEAARAARALNGEQPLDGGDCEGCEAGGMEAYEALYREMLARCQGQGDGDGQGDGQGEGGGQGMKGPGTGEGGLAESDPTLETGFVPERARAHLTAGKILMEMSEERPGTGGQVARNRDAVVGEVVAGSREAMLREEVPPAYHGTVQGYFDRLGLTRTGAGDPAGSEPATGSSSGGDPRPGGGK